MANNRNNNFIALKNVLEDMIYEMRIGDKMDEMKVRKYWHDLMGSYITNHTNKVFFKKGKLFIYIESSVLKQELFLARNKIIKDLNARLGENLVQEVIIR